MFDTSKAQPQWLVGKTSESLPNFFPISPDRITLAGAVLGLGVCSIRYAQWLNTPAGRKWDVQHTWFVTVLGVMLTLAWLAIHDLRAATKAFAFFIVSGLPIVVRALSLQSATIEAFIEREKKSDS